MSPISGSPTDREQTRRVELDSGEREAYQRQIVRSASLEGPPSPHEVDTVPGRETLAEELFGDQPTPVFAIDERVSSLVSEWHEPTEPTLDPTQADTETTQPTAPEVTPPTVSAVPPPLPLDRETTRRTASDLTPPTLTALPPPLPVEAFVEGSLPPAPLPEEERATVEALLPIPSEAVAPPRRPVQRTGPAGTSPVTSEVEVATEAVRDDAWLYSAIAVGIGAALTLALGIGAIKLYMVLKGAPSRRPVAVPVVVPTVAHGEGARSVTPIVSPLPPPDGRLPDTGGGESPATARTRRGDRVEATPEAPRAQPDLPELPAWPTSGARDEEARAAAARLERLRRARAYGELLAHLGELPPAARAHPVARLWVAAAQYQVGRLAQAAESYQSLAREKEVRVAALVGLSRTKLAQSYRTLAFSLARQARGALESDAPLELRRAVADQLARCRLALREKAERRR